MTESSWGYQLYAKNMRKVFISFFLLLVGLAVFAQSPPSFNYQAILRDASGHLLAKQEVEIGIALLQGSATGSEVFSEIHSITTNEFGLVNLQIGSLNTSDMQAINWTDGPFFIQISVDETIMGTSQLFSVPFAMHANTVENDAVDDDDADPQNEIQVLSINGDTIYLSRGGFVVLPAETDPAFTKWDKSAGISISEAQISDLKHFNGDSITGNEAAFEGWDKNADDNFTTADETDPIFSSSLAASITAVDTAQWAKDNDPQNELQHLSLENQLLSISNGNTIDLSSALVADSSASKNLQDISLNGTLLSITKGSTVDLSEIQDGDKQRLSLGVTNQHEIRLNISNANFVEMPFVKDGVSKYNWDEAENYVAKWGQYGTMHESTIYDNGNIGIGTETPEAKLEIAGQIKITGGEPGTDKILVSDNNGLATWKPNLDNDPTNELQELSISNDTISLSNGGSVKLPSETDPVYATDSAFVKTGTRNWNSSLAKKITDADTTRWGQDSDPGNELQIISISNDTLFLSSGGFAVLPADSTNSLDAAYNKGRIITADTGAVVIAGTDGLISTGTFGEGKDLSVSGAGTRMMWYPKKAAFRVGYIDDTQWNSDSIGNYSFASGMNTKVLGTLSTSMGDNTSTQAYASFAIGRYNIGGGTPNNWVETDPLFEIGNGTSENSKSNALTVLKNGNIGIGTNTPSNKLHIYMKDGGSPLLFETGGSYSSIVLKNQNREWELDNSPVGFGFYDTENREYPFLVFHNGNVGIGFGRVTTTSTPAQYPLVVKSSVTRTMQDYAFLRSTVLAYTGYNISESEINYSIAASECIRAKEFHAVSDRRIKDNIQLTNVKTDLDLINKIEVVDYQYIDKIENGNRTKKGFIAQQVEEVLPNAVGKSIKFIPDIYQNAISVVEDSIANILTITTPVDHNLKTGNQLRFITLEGTHEEEVLSVVSEKTFTVKKVEGDCSQIFVYGKQVDDFRSIDYDQVFSVGIGAIQELNRKNREQEQTITTLKQTIENLQDSNTTLKAEKDAEIQDLNQRVEILEALVKNTLKSIASEKASAQK